MSSGCIVSKISKIYLRVLTLKTLQAQVNNCTCWEELFNLTTKIRKCNIAKDAEKLFDSDYKSCKSAFIRCNKLEDQALEYMIKCYTSSSSVKTILKNLLQIQDSISKVNTVLASVVASSANGTGRRVKRQKTSEVVTCATYTTEVTTLTTVRI